MSDFDKEAEREKLREKYERDKEKRKSTQRMSELLLKGATMTNRHCEECGDPIFRYDGQEFCPTCQQAGQQQAGAASANGPDQNANAPAQTANPPIQGGDAATDTGTENDGQARAAEGKSQPTTESDAIDADAETAEPARSIDATNGASTGRQSEAPPRATAAPGGDVERGDGEAVQREGDLTAARASLIRSVERYARAAEETDDPRRARDHLAAAHEAAETLNALDR